MEHEADAMADKVMRMPKQNFIQRKCADCEEEEKQLQRKPLISFIQKKCAHCEEGKKQLQRKPLASFIQKKESLNNNIASNTISNQIQSTKGNGSQMHGTTKSFMENRFGTDFSNVNIHTGNDASQLSKDLNAQAFTMGNHIYFNEGKYQPESSTGKHLLAHELTHTIQQKQSSGKVIQKEGETGTSIDDNMVSGTQTSSATPGITLGTVEHYQYANKQDQQSGIPFHHSSINIRFDENECKIYIPHTVKFVNQSNAFPTQCGNINGKANDPIKNVNSSDFRKAADRFIKANNVGLNDWFLIRLSKAPKNKCNNRDIPIIVEVKEVTSNPDTTVIITANEGRSYVTGDAHRVQAVLCNSPDYGTMIHESGHMTLGYDDEYRERMKGRPAERERTTDFSWLAQSGPERLRLFHERHFAFVSTFVKSIIPGSNASLVYGEHSRYEPSFNPVVSFGGAGGDFKGLFFSTGLDIGIPFDSLRKTELLLGPRFSILETTDYHKDITALLYGVRLGLMGTFDTRLFNEQIPIGVGLYTELGRGHNFGSSGLPKDFSYAELGGSLSYRDNSFQIGLSSGIGVLDLNSSNALHYVRVGIEIGGRL
jgi:hypothetical protein